MLLQWTIWSADTHASTFTFCKILDFKVLLKYWVSLHCVEFPSTTTEFATFQFYWIFLLIRQEKVLVPGMPPLYQSQTFEGIFLVLHNTPDKDISLVYIMAKILCFHPILMHPNNVFCSSNHNFTLSKGRHSVA